MRKLAREKIPYFKERRRALLETAELKLLIGKSVASEMYDKTPIVNKFVSVKLPTTDKRSGYVALARVTDVDGNHFSCEYKYKNLQGEIITIKLDACTDQIVNVFVPLDSLTGAELSESSIPGLPVACYDEGTISWWGYTGELSDGRIVFHVDEERKNYDSEGRAVAHSNKDSVPLAAKSASLDLLNSKGIYMRVLRPKVMCVNYEMHPYR